MDSFKWEIRDFLNIVFCSGEKNTIGSPDAIFGHGEIDHLKRGTLNFAAPPGL